MKKDYGVFIGADNIDKIKGYNVVVVEPASIDVSGVEFLHKANEKVYAYLDIGSLENYRPYFNEFKEKTLGLYENWEDEYWMDVSDIAWQNLIVDKLGRDIVDKGFDGFFIDNCDVYYNYPNEEIYHGLEYILKRLKNYHKPIIVNGGDYFIQKYLKEHKKLFFDGINQENVFTSIDFKYRQFYEQDENATKYYLEYLDICQRKGLKIFLLEYGEDKEVLNKIQQYCDERGFNFYYSSSLELNK